MNERIEAIKQLMVQDQYNEACKRLIVLFEKNFRDPEVSFLLGKCFFNTGDISNAIRFYRKAVELRPWKREFLLALGRAYEVFGENIKAIEVYRKVLELSPEYLLAGERLMALIRASSRGSKVSLNNMTLN